MIDTTTNQQSNNKITSVSWVIFITSLVIGFTDMTISILFPPRFPSFTHMTAPMAITVLFFSFMLLFVFLIAFLPLTFLFKKEKSKQIIHRLPVSFAAFLVFFFAIASIGDLLAFSISLERALKLLITAGISLIASVMFFHYLGKIRGNTKTQQKTTAVLTSWGFALPFVFALLLFFCWQVVYNGIAVISAAFIFYFAGLMLGVSFTLWLFHFVGINTKRVLVIGLWVLVLVGYFIQPMVPEEENTRSIQKTLKAGAPKYVILVVIDSLRKDAVSHFNPSCDLTPNIDTLAKEAHCFSNAVAASSWTLPSMASIMTGMPPGVHQGSRYNIRLTKKIPTMADQMKKAGYYTGAIGINPNLKKNTNIDRGFTYYDFYPRFSTGRSFGSKIRKHLTDYIPVEKLADIERDDLQFDFNSFISTDQLTHLSVEWMRTHKNAPFFLWIHYFDPHVPYSPPPEWVKGNKKSTAALTIGYNFDRPDDLLSGAYVPNQEEKQWIHQLYNGEVRYVDHNIGTLMAALKSMGVFNEAMIILTGDHGEEFWDHGAYYHGHSLYNELLSVPLMVKLPHSTSSNENKELVGLQDIMPTVLDYCGAELRHRDWYRPSLLSQTKKMVDEPPVTTEEGVKREPKPQMIFSSALRYGEDRISICFDRFKYIKNEMTGHSELYQMETDPLEKSSVANEMPDKKAEAEALLNDYYHNLQRLVKFFKIEPKGRNRKAKKKSGNVENLKTLGYF